MGRVEILLGICACLLAVVVAQTQPECDANTCMNGGTCVDGGGLYSYVCQCVGEFWGTNCELRSGTERCPGGDNVIQPGETRTMMNLPNQYGCFYLISIPNVPELRITFTYFDIEADKDEIGVGPGLTVDDARTGADTLVLDNNYLGTPLGQTPATPFTITIPGGQAWVEVYTDKTVTSPGFTFTVEADAIDCISSPCQNGGTCNDGVNAYTCTCPPGFTGFNCEIELDFCSSTPCQNDGTCTASNSGYTCACSPGWAGLNCEININECASGPCLNNGLCVDGINLWICTCIGQFAGERCEISLNACVSSPCENGGTCVNAGLDYVCECPTGFVGDHCEIDVNECSSLPCQNGATCIDGPGWYTCQCREGFSGTNCEAVGYCDLEGVWYNECNDRVTISLTSTGMVLGDYSSSIELLTGYAAPTVVVGYANQNCDFPSFGFVVTRDNGKSTSSWSGQCHLCDGQEVLYTTWTNTQQVNTCVDIKKATHIGQDKWTRYKQSQAPREE